MVFGMLERAAIVLDFVPDFAAITKAPVTGGAHCALVPYWSSIFDYYEFLDHQVSPCGGEIVCRLEGNHVELEDSCVFYLEGEAEI